MANEFVMNWYSPNLEILGTAVSNGDGGFNLFNEDGDWQGYLLKNGNGNYNMFDKNGVWIGFTT